MSNTSQRMLVRDERDGTRKWNCAQRKKQNKMKLERDLAYYNGN